MGRPAPSSTALAVALFACTAVDDGPDLAGVWRVTAHTDNPTGCTPGPAVTEPPFIKFTRETIVGQPFYQYVHCADAGVTCEPANPLTGLAYAKDIPGGYEAVFPDATGDATSCSLMATVSQAIVAADGSLAIETRRRASTGLVGVACTTREAELRAAAGTLPCVGLETLTATRE